jgi:hypothetical protein
MHGELVVKFLPSHWCWVVVLLNTKENLKNQPTIKNIKKFSLIDVPQPKDLKEVADLHD